MKGVLFHLHALSYCAKICYLLPVPKHSSHLTPRRLKEPTGNIEFHLEKYWLLTPSDGKRHTGVYESPLQISFIDLPISRKVMCLPDVTAPDLDIFLACPHFRLSHPSRDLCPTRASPAGLGKDSQCIIPRGYFTVD